MQESIYTKIIKGDLPSHKVYEDDKTIAFLDIHPMQPGHTLVVPKVQVDLLWDLEDDDYHYLWSVAKHLAQRIGKVTGRRVGVIVDGTGVPHTHIHLVPFTKTEELLSQPDMSIDPDHPALAEMASKLEVA